MDAHTKQYLRSKFREYYQRAEIEPPPESSKREWGFIFFDESYPNIVMYRHKSFPTEKDLLTFLRERAPAHTYHSSALYEHPGAGSMDEKKWVGADLIFDLDADHLPGPHGSYAEMLGTVKQETLKLIDFLLDDFGLHEDMMQFVFSGGRGYHIHVRDSRIRGLGSAERREIVDYISGTGMSLLEEDVIVGEFSRDGRQKTVKTLRIASTKGGWSARIHRSLLKFLQEIAAMSDEQALKQLKQMEGVGKVKAERILRLSRDEVVMQGLRDGRLAPTMLPRSMWEYLIEQQKIGLIGAPDEPVTSDVKRLIRFPMSLHAGSGFQVIPLTLDELKGFDPMRDAVVFGDDATSIRISPDSKAKLPMSITLRDRDFTVDENTTEVPEYLAIFLMCRGMAEKD